PRRVLLTSRNIRNAQVGPAVRQSPRGNGHSRLIPLAVRYMVRLAAMPNQHLRILMGHRGRLLRYRVRLRRRRRRARLGGTPVRQGDQEKCEYLDHLIRTVQRKPPPAEFPLREVALQLQCHPSQFRTLRLLTALYWTGTSR